jgi:hypothetical protein
MLASSFATLPRVAALDHLLPRLQSVGRKPAHGEDQVGIRDDVLQSGAALTRLFP